MVPAATKTKADKAYHALRRIIANNELPPGTLLRHRTIAAQLGMSPTPLVQAFQRLEHEGLVESFPQWGVRVRALTVPEFEEVFRMRLALESLVFRKLASKASEIAPAIDKLRPMAQQIDREISGLGQDLVVGRRHLGEPHPVDSEFHLALAHMSGMKMVTREIDRLCLLSATIVILKPNPAVDVPTHADLLDAILTGDSDVAEKAIRATIESDLNYLLPILNAKFGDRPIIFEEK